MRSYAYVLLVLLLAVFAYWQLQKPSEEIIVDRAAIEEMSWEELKDIYKNLEKSGRYRAALPVALKALIVADTTFGKNHENYANSLEYLGEIYFQTGQFDKALPLFKQALEITEKNLGKDNPDYGDRINDLADLYRKTGQFDKALPLSLESLSIAEATHGKEHSKYANRLDDLASLYRKMGQLEKALEIAIEALEITKEAKGTNSSQYANRLDEMAAIHKKMDRLEEALAFSEEALKITENKKGKEHPDYAERLDDLANIKQDMGNLEEALPLFLNALEISKKTLGKGHPDYAERLDDLAKLYIEKGQNEKALPLLEEALENMEASLGKEHPNFASPLKNLAILHEKIGSIEESAKYYQQISTHISQQLNNQFDHFSEQEQGALFKDLQNQLNLQHSFAYRHPENSSLLGSNQEINMLTKGLLLGNRQRLMSSLRNSSDEAIQKDYQTWLDLKKKIAHEFSLPLAVRINNLEDLQDQANELESNLARTSKNFQQAQRHNKWTDIQNQLKERQAAIEFAHFRYSNSNEKTDSVLYVAYLIEKGKEAPSMIPLFEEQKLKNLLRNTSGQSVDRIDELYNYYSYEGELSMLHQLIWLPLKDYLSDYSDVFFAPTGLLHKISLGAIPITEEEIFADRLSLHHIGSLTQLVEEEEKASANKQAVIYGGLDYNLEQVASLGSEPLQEIEQLNAEDTLQTRGLTNEEPNQELSAWQYLQWTEKEVTDIKNIMEQNGISVQLLSGQNGKEDHFKKIGIDSASAQIIHLATHGYFFPDPQSTNTTRGNVFKISQHPMIRSGLIFSGANQAWTGKRMLPGKDDGILTSFEIADLNLNQTELVVLSACQTGLGDIQGNEGVYGLQRAFKMAGAHFLIMTLWSVEDFQTQEFMTTFYTNWLEEKQPLKEAFKNAKQQLRTKYYNPYYWAGFILVE